MLPAILALWLVPLTAITLIMIGRTKISPEIVNLISAIAVTALSFFILITNATQTKSLAHRYILVSPIGNWVTMCTSVVYLLASIFSVGYMRLLTSETQRKPKFYSLFCGFALSMLVAPFMNNPGLYWIVIDLTTIVSAFLISFELDSRSIEAAWKYLIIVSAGLSFALIGIVLFYWGGTFHLGIVYALTWSKLHSIARLVPTPLLLLSFFLVLVGFGTKAGLVPMHTWLPDAHSEGPAPVSAMLSGALLNTAMVGIVRFLGILNGTRASHIAHLAMVVAGLISLAAAALFIVGQKEIKRLMAYSSIEHIGIIALGFGFGGTFGLAGALYQMLNHSLNKSLMFFGAGTMMRSYQSKRISQIRKVLDFFPTTGALWILGAIAITGAPPFALFQSEVAILRSGMRGPFSWAVWIVAIFLVIIFVAFLNHFRNMYFEEAPNSTPPNNSMSSFWQSLPMWLSICPLVVLGVWWPPSLFNFLVVAGGVLK